MTWEERLVRTRTALDPVRVLEGEWEGEGQAHGEPVNARMSVRTILEGSMIEVWETVGEHTDLSLYRFEIETGQHHVLHLMAGAMMSEYPVELTLDGLIWITPPSVPAIEWRVDGETLSCDVVWPGQRVSEVSIRYRRKIQNAEAADAG